MTDDDGHAISYKVLKRGTPVRTSDGVQIGTVRRISEEKRSHIFDGIDIETPDGPRFLDAPEVKRVAELAVTTTFTAAEKDEYLVVPKTFLEKRVSTSKTVKRAKRMQDRAKERWERR